MHQSTAQAYKKIDFDLKEDLLDLVQLGNKSCHLVTSNSLYNISDLSANKVASFNDIRLSASFQNYTVGDSHFYFPLGYSNYLCVKEDGARATLELGDLDEGLLFQTRDGSRWFINNSLYSYKNKKWKASQDLYVFSKHRDVRVHRDKVYIANAGKGVFIFDDHMDLTQVTEKEGLGSDDCYSVSVRGDLEYWVGHKGTLSKCINNKIEHIDLIAELGKQPIEELESNRNGDLWGITNDNLFVYRDDRCQVMNLDVQEGETFKAIHISPEQDVWVLSNKSLYVFPNKQNSEYPVAAIDGKALSMYQIRNKQYYTNGKNVYCYDASTNTWNKDSKKKAAERVLTDERGNSILLFDDQKAMKIGGRNAQVLQSFTLPDSEEVNNINSVSGVEYIATKSSLFERQASTYQLLSHKQDAYYRVVQNENGHFAFSKNGIHKVKKDALEPFLASYNNHRYPEFYNQMAFDNKLITITENAIHYLDTEKQRLEVLDMSPLKLVDLQENGLLVWVLCSKSILALDKAELMAGRVEVVKTMPLYEALEDAQLKKYSEKALWVLAKNKMLEVKTDKPTMAYNPNFGVTKIETASGRQLLLNNKNHIKAQVDDLPLKITYSGANFWTDNVKYAYYINHDGVNTSEWKSDNVYTLNSNQSGRYTINARFKDDIYGKGIAAETFVIEVLDFSAKQAGMTRFIFIPFIIMGIILLSLLRGISKII